MAKARDGDGKAGGKTLDMTLPEALQKWVGVQPDKVHIYLYKREQYRQKAKL